VTRQNNVMVRFVEVFMVRCLFKHIS